MLIKQNSFDSISFKMTIFYVNNPRSSKNIFSMIQALVFRK